MDKRSVVISATVSVSVNGPQHIPFLCLLSLILSQRQLWKLPLTSRLLITKDGFRTVFC